MNTLPDERVDWRGALESDGVGSEDTDSIYETYIDKFGMRNCIQRYVVQSQWLNTIDPNQVEEKKKLRKSLKLSLLA